MKKKIFWSIFTLMLGFATPALIFYFSYSISRFSKSPSFLYVVNHSNMASVINKDVFEIAFVGDIMLSRNVENSIYKNHNGDFARLFEKIDFIKKADIAFGNLEGPVSISGKDAGSIYSFRFKPDALNAIKSAGFDVLSVANNHAGDWSKEAFEENIFRLKNEKIYPVGGGVSKKDASTPRIIEKGGVKIGFLGFSDVGPNWFEAKNDKPGILLVRDDFEDIIKEAAMRADVLVVSIHFGEEYKNNSNDRQKFLARTAIDNGAKIVAGHHPHVIQEVESYNGGIIAYSLGNFIFDQDFSEETMEGLALSVYLEGGEIIAVKQDKIKLNEFFQPELIK